MSSSTGPVDLWNQRSRERRAERRVPAAGPSPVSVNASSVERHIVNLVPATKLLWIWKTWFGRIAIRTLRFAGSTTAISNGGHF
jgi:hypothetical protein